MLISMIDGESWERHQGHLTRKERGLYVLSAVKAKAQLLFRSLPLRRQQKALGRIDFDRIVYPDSQLATAALEKMEVHSSSALANHCHRSYIWASLLGQLDGNRWDAEELYVSMMLHDLGLTETYHGCCKTANCFTFDCVQGAEDVLALADAETAKSISHSILIHLQMEVPGETFGWEAHYLQAGASFDVSGRRVNELPHECIKSTVERYPRDNLAPELLHWMEEETTLRPQSRFAALKSLGAKKVILNTDSNFNNIKRQS